MPTDRPSLEALAREVAANVLGAYTAGDMRALIDKHALAALERVDREAREECAQLVDKSTCGTNCGHESCAGRRLAACAIREANRGK